MGGPPSRGTPADGRLAANRSDAAPSRSGPSMVQPTAGRSTRAVEGSKGPASGVVPPTPGNPRPAMLPEVRHPG